MDRHRRQSQLAEVGVEGQARIASAFVAVRLDGLAADVAARYLAGAGVFGVRVRDAVLAEGACAIAPGVRVDIDAGLTIDLDGGCFGLRDPGARDVACGAQAALRALRAVLAGPERSA